LGVHEKDGVELTSCRGVEEWKVREVGIEAVNVDLKFSYDKKEMELEGLSLLSKEGFGWLVDSRDGRKVVVVVLHYYGVELRR